LKRLFLSMNGFGASGAVAMASALSSNEGLRELDISHNRITMDGAAQFGKFFSGNQSLEILRVKR